MGSLTDGAIRHALKRVGKSRKQESLTDGEGRGTGRLVLILKPMPTRVTAEWMVQQWRHGRRTKSKIGAYPRTSLSEAREIFKRDYAEIILKGSSIKVAVDARPGTVADLFEAYIENLKSLDKSSWPDAKVNLNKAADVLGSNHLARDIGPDDVLGVLRPIYERGKRSMADHMRSYIRSAYSWGLKSEHDYRSASPRRFKLVHNPAAGIPTEPKVVGVRWLREDEFARLYRWLECPNAPVHPPYTRAVRILMLTGQRVEEIAALHVDLGRQGTDHRLVQDEEWKTSCDPSPPDRRRTHRVGRAERIRLVLSIRKGSFKAGQRRHALQLHVAAAGSRGYPRCDES
jgi:hypothetical protein